MANTTETYKNGRPFKFTDPAELKLKIQTYFDMCDPHLVTERVVNSWKDDGTAVLLDRQSMSKQKPYLITGLARHLGVDPQTLRNYKDPDHYDDSIPEDIKQELIASVKDAYDKVHEFNEGCLYESSTFNGAKFNLTNNFGWVDKKEVDQKNTNVEGTLNALESEDDIAQNAEEQLGGSDEGPEAQE